MASQPPVAVSTPNIPTKPPSLTQELLSAKPGSIKAGHPASLGGIPSTQIIAEKGSDPLVDKMMSAPTAQPERKIDPYRETIK